MGNTVDDVVRAADVHDVVEKRISNSVPREYVEIGDLYDPDRLEGATN